jgi:transposase
MFLRVSSIKRDSKTYFYAQIVQSYRRNEDGLPAHRIVANLGQLSELEITNLKNAFLASRKNQKTYVAKQPLKNSIRPLKPNQNLVYLDLVVLLEIWKHSGISKILSEALPKSASDVSVELVLASLCFQRCIDPGSKLSATRWYKTTALPELVGISGEKFNNSRIHRALYLLEQANIALMAKLPTLYKNLDGNFSAFFLDVTDAWFCGSGPDLAETSLCKDGAFRKKIGIVLMCTKDGLPLRWEMVSGKSPDKITMIEMLEDIKSLSWLRGVPIVCDRAVGQTSAIQKMYFQNIMFLTAITRLEYVNYTKNLVPLDLSLTLDNLSRDEIVIQARKIISNNKQFAQVDQDLFTTDLGLIDIAVLGEQSNYGALKKYNGNRISKAMELGLTIKKLIAEGQFDSVLAAGISLGLKSGLANNYMMLTRLPQQVQDAIMSGDADNCSINKILSIAHREKPEDMFCKFYEHVDECNKGPKKDLRRFMPRGESAPESTKFSVRVVTYFNPQLFGDLKVSAMEKLTKIEAFIVDLNRRLASPANRRTRDSIVSEVDQLLRKMDLLKCFKMTIFEQKLERRTQFIVELKLEKKEWEEKRKFDGLCALVAHPECKLSATELCQLYRAKDVVEKDFQTIKSVLQIRPIRHHQDEKVKAHITICMLSLLLERLLKRHLGEKYSAHEALSLLHSCHLNKYKAGHESLYTITETNLEQSRILKLLKMSYLTDDDFLLERLSRSN